MNINLDELNKLNQENAANPGKIAAVYDWETQEQSFIYKVEDFKPETQELLIVQIWSAQQEEVVRKKISYLTDFIKNTPVELTGLAVQEIIRLYEMLDEWQSSTLDYAVTTSD